MAAKGPNPSKHPLNQGSIGEIFRRIIAPLVRYKPADWTLEQFLGELFAVNDRDITRYKVQRQFRMPGLYCEAPLMPVQGIGPREIKRGDIIWVRTDRQTPNSIDVQWLKPAHDHLFKLDSTQWGWVKLHCKETGKDG